MTKIDDLNQNAWTSVTDVFQEHSETLQEARATQQALYDTAQGGYVDPDTGMVVKTDRDGAALAAIEADVAPRANKQSGVHTLPDETVGVPEVPAG